MRSPYLLLHLVLVLFSPSSCSQVQTISQSTTPAPVVTQAKPVVGLATPNPLLATATPAATATFDPLKKTGEPITTRRPDSTSQGCPQEMPRYPEAVRISEEQSQYQRIAVYETDRDPELIFDYYDTQLEPKGWSIYSRTYGNGLERAWYGYRFPDSVLDTDIYIPQVIQNTYQYTVSLKIGTRSPGGFDDYCSHLYP
jgi:hypothetical protein